MTYTLDPDLVTAAVARLSAYAPFQEMVAEGLIGSDDDGTVWLFQGLDQDGRPFRDPEGTGKCVVVLMERQEWAAANAHNTAHFPLLQMLIYADCTRNVDGAVVTRDADRKAKHVFQKLDRCFHLPSNLDEDKRWAIDANTYVDVHSCLRGDPATISDVPQTEWATVRLEARYTTITD